MKPDATFLLASALASAIMVAATGTTRAADPNNQITYENRDRIIVRDLEGLCAPGLHD